MLSTSAEFKIAVYEPVREFKSRARIETKNLDASIREKIYHDFSNKITGDVISNPSNAKYRNTTGVVNNPTWFTVEATQDQYNRIISQTGSNRWSTASTTLNVKIYHYYGFDIIGILTNYYGVGIWQGKTALADKIEIAKDIITSLKVSWQGFGSSPTGNKATLQTFSTLLNNFDSANGKSHTNGTVTEISVTSLSTYSSNTPANKIDASGFFHAMVFSEATNGTIETRLDSDYVYLEIETSLKNYDDSTIMKVNILEEISVLNESLPSNELQLTLDNSNGDFNFLSFENMHLILAKKPRIEVEFGLLTNRITYGQFTGELKINLTWSGIVNPGEIQVATVNGNEVIHPNGNRFIVASNTEIGTHLEGTVYVGTFYLMYIGQNFARFSATKPYATYSEDFVYCQQQGNKWLYWHNATTSYEFTPNWQTDCLVGEFTKTSVVSGAGIDSLTQYLESKYNDTFEWIPSGTFFLTDWKNEITNKIVTFTAHDYFTLFSEISYEPVGITNLKTLATDVLTKCGVPSNKIIIDNTLAAMTVNTFPERIDARTALQHIGIVGVSAVFQDRNGNIVIKPFKAIDENSNYITYTTSQLAISGYAGPTSYPLNDSGGGMRYLDYDQMYEPPQVSLQKSIYQLVVKVYATADPTERLYTNAFIQGTSGQSFTIDNPLIKTNAQADKVAEWYMKEINYNALYTAKWRQNPALECTDIILIEDSFNAEKQTRIVRQEINYSGYLEGMTESRGGV